MTNTFSPQKLLMTLVNCQRVGPPYRGWDLHVLDQRIKHIQELGYHFEDPVTFTDKNLELIHKFIQCKIEHGWNVTKLGKTAAEARLYLGFPSVEDLNPDIAMMTQAVKKNGLNRLRRFK
jgi:hypothetical protein